MTRKHDALHFFELTPLNWPPTIDQIKDAYNLNSDVAAAEKLLSLVDEVPNAASKFLVDKFYEQSTRPRSRYAAGGSECGTPECQPTGEFQYISCEELGLEDCMAEKHRCPDGPQWVCPPPQEAAVELPRDRTGTVYHGANRRVNGPRRQADRELASRRGDGKKS